MAVAILTLRRGTATPSLAQSELFFNTTSNTLNVGGIEGTFTLVKLGSNTGNITLTGNLGVVGGISGSTLDITGNAKIDGNIFIGGNIVLGNEPSDNITVNAPFIGSLIPQQDNQEDLGTSTKRFKELHVVSASIDNISLPGSGILSSSVTNFTDFSQSVDFRLDTEEGKSSTLENYTSSVNNRLNRLELDSASQDNRLDDLEEFTALQEDLNGTFATTGSNTFSDSQTISGSITVTEIIKSQVYINPKTLNGFTVPTGHNAMLVGPVDINGSVTLEGDSSLLILDKITLPDGLLSSSVTDFDTFSASLEGRVDNLAFATTQSNIFIGNQTITGSLLVSGSSIINEGLNVLGSVTASVFSGSFIGDIPAQDSRLDSLEEKSASVDTSLTELNQYTSSLNTAISVNGSNLTVNGDLIVQGTTTQIDSTQVNIGDNIIELNYGGSSTEAGIYTKDATGASLVSGSLLWDSTNDYWKAGKKDLESKILLQGGDNILSGSAQITASLDSIYLRKSGDSVVSSSVQIDITQTSGYPTFSSSLGDRLTSLELDSSSQDDRITQLESDSGSQGGRIVNLELFTSSQESKNTTLQTYTSSVDDSISQLESFTSSIDTTIKNKINLEGVVSSSSDTSTISLSIQNGVISGSVIGGVVSGSDQLTSSLDGLYEVSGSVSQLVGILGVSGSLGSAAWYNVSSSISDGNPQVLGNAGAVKDYIDEQLLIIGAGDITAVIAGNGISGGADSGPATVTLDTSSQHFVDGVDARLIPLTSLNSYTGSQDTKNSNLATYTASIDSHISNLNTATSSYETNGRGIVSGSSQLTPLLPPGVVSGSSQITYTSISSIPAGIVSGSTQVTPLLPTGTISGSSQVNLASVTGNSTTNVTEGTNLYYTDARVKTKLDAETVVSGSSQITYTSISSIPAGIVSGSTQVTPLLPVGVVSGSSQITYTSISSIPAGIVSGSSQLDGTNITNLTITNLTTVNQTASVIFSSGSNKFGDFGNDTHEFTGSVQITGSLTTIGSSTATSFNGTINATNGVISSSLQLTSSLPTGVVSGSSQIILLLPSGVVSGSSQVTKTLQEVTTAGASTSTAITITNATASTSKTSGALVVTGGIGTSGDIFVGGDVVAFASSDARLKTQIKPIENSLQKINQISGYSFVWNNQKQDIYTGKDYGVIAQEIEQILPELVNTREDGYKAVKYDRLISLLIEGIKDLSTQVQNLQEKINRG